MHRVYYSYVIGMKEEGILRHSFTAWSLAHWRFLTRFGTGLMFDVGFVTGTAFGLGLGSTSPPS